MKSPATFARDFATLAALAIVAATAPALAASPDAAPSKWVKVCETDEGKQSCTVMQRLVGPGGDLVASVSVRQTPGSPKVQFIVSMPLGLSIKPGLSVAIDNKVKLPLKFGVCLPAGCYAEIGSDQTLVTALKSGGSLTIVAASRTGTPIALPITLAGFTKAFDGKGLDMAAAKSKFAELAKLDIADAQAKLAKFKEAKAKAKATE